LRAKRECDVRAIKGKRGQALIEYLIIVAIMAVASIAVVRVLGQNLTARFANIAFAIQGKKESARYETLPKSAYKKRDLSDFFEGAAKDE
jgi:Flp pilus assembly pilin Flp